MQQYRVYLKNVLGLDIAQYVLNWEVFGNVLW